MPNRITFAFFLLLAIASNTFAAVFVVTSNADSGPGTLREALTLAAANGSAEKDFINFNLPDTSKSGRTIILQSMLPAISSNMVVDGITQTGSNVSSGDARIIITVNRYAYIDNMNDGTFTLLNVHDVEIYGLLFSGFNDLRNPYGSFNDYAAGIYIVASQNIIIGSPGKGNSFQDNNYEIIAQPSYLISGPAISKVKIQANYFGFNNPNQPYVPSGVAITGNNLIIGGNNLNEGNHFAVALAVGGDTIKISHNHFGIGLNGKFQGGVFQDIVCSGASALQISYNTSFILRLSMTSVKNFNIFGNVDINTDSSLSSGGISFQHCSDGIIGSDDEKLKNIFHTNTGETNDQITVTLANGSSNNIKVLKNEIVCSRTPYYISLESTDHIVIPYIKVLVNNATEYSGTASPNSKIYVYQDTTDCPVCSPVKFDTVLTADTNGLWKITGNLTGKKWISNALLANNSSEFTQPLFPYLNNYYSIIQPSCGKSNGSISITANFKNIVNFEWYDSNNQKIGDGPILHNAGPGIYYAKGFNGLCFARSVDIYLYDVSPAINSANVNIQSPSCGVGGSITGLLIKPTSNDPLSFTWTDINNKIVGTGLNITNLTQGAYLFTLTDTLTKCSVTYGPINIKNATGPNIDQSSVVIQSTNCGQSTGSITNLNVTGAGTLKYIWWNSRQQTVGTTKDLLNQPAGTYKLQVTDDSQCGAIYSTDIEIPEINGIVLDESAVQTKMSSCNSSNGSISGLKVTGATTYEWTDGSSKIVGTSVDLQNVAAGIYTLTASNPFGCNKISAAYHISMQPPTRYPNYASTIYQACTGKANGGVNLPVDTLVHFERWVNDQGQTAGTGIGISNVPAGAYQVYLTDRYGCESLYATYIIPSIPPLQIMAEAVQISNDECSENKGSITNIQVSGGRPPYTYAWFDANNNKISTALDLSGMGEGAYTFTVNDQTTCGLVSAIFTITNQTLDIPAPQVNNSQVCNPGEALLQVKNPTSNYSYRLYDSQTSATPLDIQTDGVFKIAVKTGRSYFISQTKGRCESERSEATVSVGLSSLDIANVITPNGDGINDYWIIKGITNYPQAIVQVFTRFGQKVYESKGYSVPFNGTFNGTSLPTGAYYYIINLNTNCNLLSGTLTIIR